MALSEGAPALMALVGSATLEALLPRVDAHLPPGGVRDDFEAPAGATS